MSSWTSWNFIGHIVTLQYINLTWQWKVHTFIDDYHWLSHVSDQKLGLSYNSSIFPSFSHSFPKSWGYHNFFFHPVIYMKFTLPAMALWGIPHGYRELQIFHDGYNRGTSTTTKSLRWRTCCQVKVTPMQLALRPARSWKNYRDVGDQVIISNILSIIQCIYVYIIWWVYILDDI